LKNVDIHSMRVETESGVAHDLEINNDDVIYHVIVPSFICKD
jgi:hypothetical protein